MNFLISFYHAGLRYYEVVASLLYSGLRFRPLARDAFAPDDAVRAETVVIAMNGPTLMVDLNRISRAHSDAGSFDYAVANHFADTEFFSRHRPKHYFFSDPYFWDDAADFALIDKRRATFSRITETANWPMRIYFPAHANTKPIKDAFAAHTNIQLHPFNAAALPSNFSCLQAAFWRRNICAPYGQNVLIHAVYSCVQLGYRQILIAGAGFSFHEQIHVDQHNNTFYKRRRHIYGKTQERAFLNQRKTTPAHVSSEFQALYNAFRSLEAVANYAENEDCNVVNFSQYSYLDMFDRPANFDVIDAANSGNSEI